MGRAAAARRLAAAAAYGGGGLSVLGASLYGRAPGRGHAGPQGDRQRPTAGCRTPPAGTAAADPGRRSRSRCWATRSAAGLRRRARVEETPGAWLGSGVAERADRRVHLREFAVVGAQSQRPGRPGRRRAQLDPDVAVILIGANDVTHSVLPAASVRHLSEAVRRLREADVEVVVGTCPDLGTISPIPMPLRQVARVWSRRLAAAQTIAVVEAGGRTVSLGLDPRTRVRGGTGAAVRARPVPPLGRGLRGARPAAGALGALRARPGRGRGGDATRRSRRGRAADRLRRRHRPARTPAPRSTAPRSAAPSAASAAAGSR